VAAVPVADLRDQANEVARRHQELDAVIQQGELDRRPCGGLTNKSR
jgi:hypothetical protein